MGQIDADIATDGGYPENFKCFVGAKGKKQGNRIILAGIAVNDDALFG